MSLFSALFRVLTFRRRPAPRPPPLAMPPSVPRRALAVVVPGIAGATVTLDAFLGVTNADGYLCFPTVPASVTRTTLTVTARDYEPYVVLVDLPADGRNYNLMVSGSATGPDQIACPALVPTLVVLPGLVGRRAVFALATGERWTAIECSDFQLFHRFLRGEAITPVLEQRATCGFNLLRVALTCDFMFTLHPTDYPAYFDQLVAFVRALARHGLRPELVVFMDATIVLPVPTDQLRFFVDVVDALQPVADQVLLELVNENDQRVNTIDPRAFPQPPGILSSHGSNGSQSVPVRPAWSYETFHTNDAPEWPRKVGHNAMEWSNGGAGFSGSGRPVLSNENTRCPDRFNSVTKAFDAAAGAALLCAGSCFHSVHGKVSELFDDAELACAQAWVAGARSVPLAFTDGAYRHRIDLEGPGILRAYDRVLPDGASFAVRIRS
jgi:hypothetical protein